LTVSEYLSNSDSSAKAPSYVHILFFFNCMGTPIQTLAMKPLLRKYPTPTILAWSYSLAGLLHLCAAAYFNSSTELLDIMCPPPAQSCGNGWEVDLSAGAHYAHTLYSLHCTHTLYSLHCTHALYSHTVLTHCTHTLYSHTVLTHCTRTLQCAG
jgi:hypothetical protein